MLAERSKSVQDELKLILQKSFAEDSVGEDEYHFPDQAIEHWNEAGTAELAKLKAAVDNADESEKEPAKEALKAFEESLVDKRNADLEALKTAMETADAGSDDDAKVAAKKAYKDMKDKMEDENKTPVMPQGAVVLVIEDPTHHEDYHGQSVTGEELLRDKEEKAAKDQDKCAIKDFGGAVAKAQFGEVSGPVEAGHPYGELTSPTNGPALKEDEDPAKIDDIGNAGTDSKRLTNDQELLDQKSRDQLLHMPEGTMAAAKLIGMVGHMSDAGIAGLSAKMAEEVKNAHAHHLKTIKAAHEAIKAGGAGAGT